MRDISDGAVVTFFCQGDHRNPDFQFLDALTGSNPPSVKLSPRSDGVFTGTHWQCMEQTDGGHRRAGRRRRDLLWPKRNAARD